MTKNIFLFDAINWIAERNGLQIATREMLFDFYNSLKQHWKTDLEILVEINQAPFGYFNGISGLNCLSRQAMLATGSTNTKYSSAGMYVDIDDKKYGGVSIESHTGCANAVFVEQ